MTERVQNSEERSATKGCDTLEEARNGSVLTVGINCLRVDPLYVGGVTTLVLGLLQGLSDIGSECRFRLFASTRNQRLFAKFSLLKKFDVIVIDDQPLSIRENLCRMSLLSWSSTVYKFTSDIVFAKVQQLMDSESDILYTPTPVLCCFNGRRPAVLTMHDIQHLHHPEFFSWSRLLSRRITYELSARHANFFQANSAYIREDLLHQFPWLMPEQIEVIPPGVRKEEYATPKDLDLINEKYQLPERFLFFPAQLWPHKNHLTILSALKNIERQSGVKIPLVLTGAKFSAAPRIFAYIQDQAMDYVHYLGTVPAEDMIALYQRAEFMITATLHESSSFPILEAAAAGTPVIASSIPPFEEFGKVLKLNLFNPYDVEKLSRVIVELWSDEKTAFAQSAYNLDHIDFYSWENSAKRYLKLFQRAVNS